MKTLLQIARMAVLLGAIAVSHATEISVYAASSLSDVFKELAPQFTAASGHSVRFNFGASGLLARQIKEGAPADAIFSADELRIDQLEKAGLLRPGTRHTFLANTLVIVVAASSKAPIATLSDIIKPEVRRVVIGEPVTVPAGTYTREYFQKQDLWKPVAEKLVPVDSVRSVLAAIEAGNADVGFVYKTDALISKKVRIAVEIPQDQGPKINYPGAVLKNAPHAEAAEAFLVWLSGPIAQAAFLKYGFQIAK